MPSTSPAGSGFVIGIEPILAPPGLGRRFDYLGRSSADVHDRSSAFRIFPFPSTPMLSASPTYLLYFVPLLLSISLVFGGTRHENTNLIIRHALGTARWIVGFVCLIFFVLFVLDWIQ